MYKLVIVEDEFIERDALAGLVDWPGMGLCLAGCFESGEDALAYAREHPFDVLFTDIRLLGMSGLDLAKQILAVRPSVKVIINSGYSEFEYARRAIQVKAISYLTKPLDMQELRQTVCQTIRMLDEEAEKRRAVEQLDLLVKLQRPSLHEDILAHVGNDVVTGEEAAEALSAIGVDTDRNVIRHIMSYVVSHLDRHLSAEHLAEVFHFSPSYIGIAFKRDTGMTLTEYVRDTRMDKARQLLREPGTRVSEIAARVGYPNVSYFCAVFKRAFGMNPGEYREHG